MSASALSSSSGKAIHQAANSSQPAHQAAPSSPNRAATTRAMPKGPAPTMAVQGRAAPSVADLNRAAAACPVTSRPTAAPSSPPLAEPAASAAQASASGSLMTGAVWQSLHAFVKERLPGGRKRTHAGAFAEPQATADSAAHTTSGPESSQHAKSGQAQLAAQQLLTKSASQPEAPENKMGQVASRSVISPGTVDLTLTSSDSEGGTARLLSSKKKRGRRASGAGSDPIEIDFTTSEDSKSLTPSHQHSKDSASHGMSTATSCLQHCPLCQCLHACDEVHAFHGLKEHAEALTASRCAHHICSIS